MLDFFVLIKDFFVSVFNVFEQHTFFIGDFEVSYISLVFVFLVSFMVVSIFWKGAKA